MLNIFILFLLWNVSTEKNEWKYNAYSLEKNKNLFDSGPWTASRTLQSMEASVYLSTLPLRCTHDSGLVNPLLAVLCGHYQFYVLLITLHSLDCL